MMDVVEAINELAAEEKCPHCERDFHEMALTRDVARMFDAGRFNADYFSREDTSPVLCDGSRFIGPLRPDPPAHTHSYSDSFTFTVSGLGSSWSTLGTVTWPKVTYYDNTWNVIVGGKAPAWIPFPAVWSTAELKPAWTGPVPEVDVEFGPQNWLPVKEPGGGVFYPPTLPQLTLSVLNRWHQFTRPEPVPVPASPGYDFTAFDVVDPKYPTKKKGNRHEGI